MTTDERIDAIARHLHELTVFSLKAEERHDREIVKIDDILRRAIRAGVQEARQERVKRRELEARLTESHAKLDEKLAELAAAQKETEAAIQRFLKRSTNGKP
jgi:hypothetical protein